MNTLNPRRQRTAQRRPALLLGLVLLAMAPSAAGDALSALPAAWQAQLQAVPEADISGTEQVARDAITRTRQRLAQGLQRAPGDTADLAEGYASLAALYQLFHIDSAAALCWDNARSLQPGEFRWHYYAGYLALTRGRTDRALTLLAHSRELKPDYAPLDLRLGQLWLESGELQKAGAALQRAAAHPGLRAAALYHLGQLALLERDYPGAERYLGEALAIDPAATGLHYPLAQAYRHQGKTEQARKHLALFKPGRPAADDPLVNELRGVLETSRADFSQGMRAINALDYPTAIQHFRDGLAIDPDNLAARVSYARALYLDGQSEAAARELNNVVQRDPRQIMANFFLAVLLEAGGEPEAAAQRYGHILKLDPRQEGARFYLANLRFKQHLYREAADHYAAALEANPDIPPAQLLELVARYHAGEAPGVLAAELEKRIAAWPDQPQLKYAMIRLRSLSTEAGIRDSVRALTLANQLAPQQPTPPHIEALALAAAADGQFEQAARLQQQVIEMMGWMPDAARQQILKDTLSAYEQGVLPQQPVWPADDPLLAPPPLNPSDPFRHYPAAVPF